ncbi:MAG: hypothetical protein ACRD3E_09775 [Terriglobales bacterium]
MRAAPNATARHLPFTTRLPEPFGAVRVEISASTRCILFTYLGTREELLACGAATVEILAPGPKSPKGAHDLDGDRYMKCRRGRRLRLRRFKSKDRAAAMPGFEAWMLDVPPPSLGGGDLTPDEWRAQTIENLRSNLGSAIWSVIKPREDGLWRHLPLGFEPVAADVEAFTARAHASMEELVDMVSRMRIVSNVIERRGLRLVVDNTRP